MQKSTNSWKWPGDYCWHYCPQLHSRNDFADPELGPGHINSFRFHKTQLDYMFPVKIGHYKNEFSSEKYSLVDARIKLVAQNEQWPMCVYIKATKTHRTMLYLQTGIPVVSMTVSGSTAVIEFALLNASTMVKPSDSGRLRTPAGILLTTSTISFSLRVSLLTRQHLDTGLLASSASTAVTVKVLKYNADWVE